MGVVVRDESVRVPGGGVEGEAEDLEALLLEGPVDGGDLRGGFLAVAAVGGEAEDHHAVAAQLLEMDVLAGKGLELERRRGPGSAIRTSRSS